MYIIIGLVVGFLLGRRRFPLRSFQNDGEAHLSKEIQRLFCAPDYHLMNHVTLKLEGGTTQIDHILISKFGVFVIETKDYNGWIFANAKPRELDSSCISCEISVPKSNFSKLSARPCQFKKNWIFFLPMSSNQP